MKRSLPAQRGLTLIELMVALAIFAVLGVLSYRGLAEVATSRTHLEAGFERWQEWYFGAKPMAPGGYAAVGGAYDHDTKRLVARDLGSTLRHEFMHVLHWRMCVRAGQIHPVWLQEGLCSLVEDYDLKDGSLRPAPSYRTNTAKRLTKAGGLLTIAALTSLDRDHFIGTRPMANYAQARTLFMFISDRQRLGDWYAEFTRRWSGVNAEEATRGAFEAALRMPMDEVEKSYRAYVRAMPEVPEQLASGRASLGVVVETGAGDGPVVVEVVRRDGAGLKLGDVVISIDGKPTRDTPELVRVLGTSLDGGYAPGASVVVRVKRDGKQIDVPLTLVPR
ncbi:PDZ domain-containing protein [Zoogloea sp.]|uniref:PDZ domain-containing protein n=1 Tax=Zoogloea sp. TaxID=49181 RepID=UPI001AC2C3F9|nr:PDZ domain-containing protein [Zoogloea sp.]MBN8284156.1 PDZ domain-containing protein [Zoogloea sp.]